jgi:hypothetical protein
MYCLKSSDIHCGQSVSLSAASGTEEAGVSKGNREVIVRFINCSGQSATEISDSNMRPPV